MNTLERMKILEEDEISRIHENSLRILDKTGVYMHSEDVLGICSNAGPSVNKATRIVKIPPETVERCMTGVPGRVQLFDRKKVRNAELGSGRSNAKLVDVQSGYERSMSTLNAALSGSNLIVLHGSIYGEYTYHPVCAVIDDDIATWVGRLIEGFAVNEETLALGLIEEVGPIPGTYLNKAHTRTWWKRQQFIPNSADRTNG